VSRIASASTAIVDDEVSHRADGGYGRALAFEAAISGEFPIVAPIVLVARS